MMMTRIAVVLGTAGALTLGLAGAASAAPSGGGCNDATLGRSFGEVCTFDSTTNPFGGWYSGDGAPAATVRLGLRISDGRTLWTGSLPQAANGGAVTRNWAEAPYQAGLCYTALVEIGGAEAAGPSICA
ncbi:hypothetical protein [Actinoplanes sp. NPDC051411]|uniref:hypothetical protein n=1 Tax=Actinoplanes sp. NPDC051411 TaxID=3155522 RepID=UPI003426BDE1